MSSTYGILCLSHDPAITAHYGFRRAEAAQAALLAGIDEHKGCDLVIGRYSAALTEIGCPASGVWCSHLDTHWTDASWLRLLMLAQQEPAGTDLRQAANGAAGRCWPERRLRRLGPELGITPVPAAEGEVDRSSDAADHTADERTAAAEEQHEPCPLRFRSFGTIYACDQERGHSPNSMCTNTAAGMHWIPQALGAFTKQPAEGAPAAGGGS